MYARSYEDNFRIRSVDFSAKPRASRSSRSDPPHPSYPSSSFPSSLSFSRQCIVSHGTLRSVPGASRERPAAPGGPLSSRSLPLVAECTRGESAIVDRRNDTEETVRSLAVSIIHIYLPSPIISRLYAYLQMTKERKPARRAPSCYISPSWSSQVYNSSIIIAEKRSLSVSSFFFVLFILYVKTAFRARRNTDPAELPSPK